MPPRVFRPLRTLIVDASEAFRDALERWAADRPELTVVETIGSGTEALSLIDRVDPDLVLLDGCLPGLDGFRLVRLIKARHRAPLAVVHTFHATEAARLAAMAAGADGFVPKSDYIASLELLLGDLARHETGPRAGSVSAPERSARSGSRISRDR